MKTESKTELRWLIRRDMPDVLRISNQSFLDAWSESAFLDYLRNSNVVGKVALNDNGSVIGYWIYELHRDRIQIAQCAVDPIYRRSGIGRSMLENAISKLSFQRRRQIWIDVSEYNLPAQLWLRACGFKAVKCDSSGIRFNYALQGG